MSPTRSASPDRAVRTYQSGARRSTTVEVCRFSSADFDYFIAKPSRNTSREHDGCTTSPPLPDGRIMSTSASGTVLDENGTGISGLRVYLEDVSRLRVISLGRGATDSNGRFSITPYAEDAASPGTPGKQARLLRLTVRVGQHVVKEAQQADSPQAALTFDTITV